MGITRAFIAARALRRERLPVAMCARQAGAQVDGRTAGKGSGSGLPGRTPTVGVALPRAAVRSQSIDWGVSAGMSQGMTSQSASG
mgnify:CR=1 FL=1